MARLIEPWIARSVARRLTGDSRLAGSYLLDRLHRDLADAVPRAEKLVADASGIASPPPVKWRIIDRAAWADANIRSMTTLLGPLATKIEERLDAAPMPVRVAQRTVVSAEVGALLGYVSRRVLGQYDLLISGLPEDGDGPARDSMLFFVGPNMVETERRFGFIPEEFALWVAVHEVTHRFQFDGVPWVRQRFFSLMRSYLDAIELDARGLARRLAEGASRLARRSLAPEERSPVYLLASPEQRAIMDQVQALMAVVEGHGNFVMDHVGAQVIPSFKRMRGVFETRRRQTNLVQRAFHHAIGLELKLRQYELGKEFCDEVVATAGMDVLSDLWTSEDRLPTLDELRTPKKWLARVA
jgi:coenzyme F420 biosynthesis associated uncharacterized protein